MLPGSVVAFVLLLQNPTGPMPSRSTPVVVHDNRTPAGRLDGGVLTLSLRAGVGTWHPEGAAGRAIVIEAFGEGLAPLSAPSPMIRVPEGTVIAATVRNELSRALRVQGLCERGLAACPPLDVPAGETRGVRFTTGPAGTYHYWATSSGMPQQFRAVDDTQLSGAIVVDPPGGRQDDRVFVITEWSSLTREQLQQVAGADDPGAEFLRIRPDVFFAINGRIWPHTERLRYTLADTVRWRVINLSTQVHPMHLHGFYFTIDAAGNGAADRQFPPEHASRVVTHAMSPGATLAMTWKPERPGNWLFHCHVLTHVSPTLHVDGSEKPAAGDPHDGHAAGAGMTGMVVGVTVEGPDTPDSWRIAGSAPRRLALRMEAVPAPDGASAAYAFALRDGSGVATPPAVPGPPLVLTRGEPVEITLANALPEATAIHWHGMELESYYDGVHGWGGNGTRVTPMIQPGEEFVVRFTPPRSGTFIYHTHLHDGRQLASGLYGALLVLEPGERFEPKTDHVIVLGRGGPQRGAPVVIDGRHQPVFTWTAGLRHRIRIVNITPDDILSVSLQTSSGPVTWRPVTKDGAPVPAAHREPVPGRQVIAVGETYDFELDLPPARQNLWLEVRSTGGRWHAQGQIIVR